MIKDKRVLKVTGLMLVALLAMGILATIESGITTAESTKNIPIMTKQEKPTNNQPLCLTQVTEDGTIKYRLENVEFSIELEDT